MPFKIQRTLELSSNQFYNLGQNLLRNNPVPLNHENYTRWFLINPLIKEDFEKNTQAGNLTTKQLLKGFLYVLFSQ